MLGPPGPRQIGEEGAKEEGKEEKGEGRRRREKEEGRRRRKKEKEGEGRRRGRRKKEKGGEGGSLAAGHFGRRCPALDVRPVVVPRLDSAAIQGITLPVSCRPSCHVCH
jgi:hypothetical protein